MKLQNLIGEGWYDIMKNFLSGEQWKNIEGFLSFSMRSKINIYPDLKYLFRAFNECPYKDLKVVLLNSRPFEHEKANDGLAFSISDPEVMYKPPMEATAFMEGVESDVYGGLNFDRTYDLKPLANQGVLLLNASLTIQKDKEGHWVTDTVIWKPFIKELLTNICAVNQNIVFIFVGIKDEFEEFSRPIINSKNYILSLQHPSEAAHFAQTYNAANAFKLTNMILKSNKIKEIKW